MFSSLFGKRGTACPYCYQDLDVRSVAFRCAGRGAPGRPPCTPARDPKRRRVFDDEKSVMPTVKKKGPTGELLTDESGEELDLISKESVVCTECDGATSVRVCPSCHSLLPRSLDNGSPLFGMVGVPGSGKTVLLSVLHKQLVRNVARRFDASIDTPGGSSGHAAVFATNEANMSTGNGELPPKTQQAMSTKQAPAVYEWKYSKNGKTSATIFSFYDSAGEDVSRQEEVMKRQYLGQASGVIFLLDPFSFPENLDRARKLGVDTSTGYTPEEALDGITYVLQTAHNVKRNKKIRVPLAVVVSKIDAFLDQVPQNHPLRQPASTKPVFDETESQDIHDHVTLMIDGWGGDALLRKLEHEYSNYRVFGVSALGAEPDYRTMQVSARGVLPYRVEDPLLWLMADRGFIPVSRQQ